MQTDPTAMPSPLPGITPKPRGSTLAVLTGFLGWTLDAFDYFLVTLCSVDIAKTLGVRSENISWCYWATLATRPIGALIFGLMADRFGRRQPLMINLVFFSALSILSGMATSFWMFLMFRLLFGIGMGGEWGVGASLAMEKVPVRLRGVLSGLLQEGYAVGSLLASGAYFFLIPHFAQWFPHTASWRLLFFLGGGPALLALIVRFYVTESEVWEHGRSKQQWNTIGSAVSTHFRLFLVIMLIMFMMNMASHGTQDLFPKLLKKDFNRSPLQAAQINAVAAVGMIFGGLVIGLLSDHIGRRWAIGGSLLLAMLVVPIWAYAPSIATLVVGAFVIQFFVQGAWGVIPAHITELSPDNVRGFLPGFGYQCGAALAGFILPFQEWLAGKSSLKAAMGTTSLAAFVLGAIVIFSTRERRGVNFGSDEPGKG